MKAVFENWNRYVKETLTGLDAPENESVESQAEESKEKS